jgi:riboflavin kinase/FMN adenylyltransferase
MADAIALLGEPYFLTGIVSHGDGRGKALGLPTVNTDLPSEKLLPKKGVYRSAVCIGDRLFSGVTNIGTCPTFEERPTHAETYILDFSGDIYGKEIRVYLLEFIREEKHFKTPEELILQIKLDINYAIMRNGEQKWQELGLK